MWVLRTLIMLGLTLVSSLTSCERKTPPKLLIATAANMQYPMAELRKAFFHETGIPCEAIISSSGKLTAQIKAGAPFHVFIAADMAYPETLYQEGYTLNAPKTYAHGTLALWTVNDTLTPTINALTANDIKHIAIANPEVAPYGKAAAAFLKKRQLYDKIAQKLVFGESIAQVNQFVMSGAAEIGITAKSVVQQQSGRSKTIDITDYPPILLSVTALKTSHVQNGAQKFQEFLFSESARAILENFGYVVP